MSCSNCDNMALEVKQALIQTECVIKSRGMAISLKLDDEETVERDEWGSIKKRTSPVKTMYAFPVTFSPTTKQKDRNGIKGDVQVICTTSMKSWTDLGYTDKDLSHIDSIRATVILRGQTYEIRDKNMDTQLGNTFLYVILGLNRK